MEINKNCESISSVSVSCESSAEQPVQCDITLPDYFPDIVRIVRCSMRADIMNSSLSSGKLTVDGKATLSVLYISDDSRAHCFEQRIPFTKSIDVSDNQESLFTVDAKTEYVNCRVATQRKLDVHASITLNYTQMYIKADRVLCGCDDDTVRIRPRKLNAANLRDYQVKSFSVNETLEIGSEQPTVSQIVTASVQPVLSSTKLISDKILIKGELNVKVLYLSEAQQEFNTLVRTIPFSQIVEAKSSEDSHAFVKLDVSGFDVYAKTDSSGALRLFDLSANIRAQVKVFDSMEINVADDIYSTRYELSPLRSKLDINSHETDLNDTFLTRNTVEFADEKLTDVIDVSIEDYSVNTRFSDGKVIYNGSAILSVITSGENGIILYTEKQADFQFEKKVDLPSDMIYAQSDISITGVSFSLESDNSVEIRSEFCINTQLFTVSQLSLISDFVTGEEKNKDSVSRCVTVYFADSGENLWDIAKRFNSTVEQLMRENSLTSDILETDTKLIVIGD